MKQFKSLPAILLSLLLSAGLSSCEKVDDLGYSNKHILELKANGEEHIYHRNFAANNQSPYDFYSNSSTFIVRFNIQSGIHHTGKDTSPRLGGVIATNTFPKIGTKYPLTVMQSRPLSGDFTDDVWKPGDNDFMGIYLVDEYRLHQDEDDYSPFISTSISNAYIIFDDIFEMPEPDKRHQRIQARIEFDAHMESAFYPESQKPYIVEIRDARLYLMNDVAKYDFETTVSKNYSADYRNRD